MERHSIGYIQLRDYFLETLTTPRNKRAIYSDI